MALSRMCKLGEMCNLKPTFGYCNRTKFLQNGFRSTNIRNSVSSKSDLTPFTNMNINRSNLKYSALIKPFGFTVIFAGGCFGGAAIWQYENMRAHAIEMLNKRMIKIQEKKAQYLKIFENYWNKLTPGERIFAPICLINILVFLAWRIPRLQPFMLKYFCSNPGGSSTCLPMLLSTFSHYSAVHLMANMYVLHSFSTGAVATLGKEQFLGLYLGAGVFSSFTSYVYKIITKQPGLSLGASGAIMAILGYICTQYPDTKLGIIFFPFLTFSAGSAIKVIMGLDTAGVIFGWKLFDHAAHLGGAICGISWAYWGNEHLWQKRDFILQHWHDIRGQIK